MIKKKGEYNVTQKPNAQGGKGTVDFSYVLEEEKGELYGKGRLFAMITVKPGDSIGYHVHEGEMECYYILSGSAKYSDNGTELQVTAGDTTITADGEGHSIENTGDEDLVFAALILYTK